MKRFALILAFILLVSFQVDAARTKYSERDIGNLTLVSNTNLSENHILNYKHFDNRGASVEVDVKLPSINYPIEIIFTVVASQIIEICGPLGEVSWLDGGAMDANDCVDTPADEGSILTVKRESATDGTWRWHFLSVTGNTVDTGPSD